ncbi:DUF1885 family protein [Pseudalkalibacillus caeni]|uniref:DUF1885 family protein n=1 Tax=Exobacillus caeni TaxID=2574798 RepID=A0A5R9F3V8_9BACL|nr:DUF1885 family protein [Pseudalkalibacillus caeni]TLS37691.1 DUF1885 family protein [Pseudalkalibacillus caeni]
MGKSAFVKLVTDSLKQEITIEEIKALLKSYIDHTYKTGEQLNWSYMQAAFPYQIEETSEGRNKWFYLKGNTSGYYYIVVGLDKQNENNAGPVIQIALPEKSTHGDKGKAIEFCKYIASKLQGELTLFNGRKMFYYKK